MVDHDTLQRHLAVARRTRIAYDDQESALGVFCVASPVLGPRGVVAAMSVKGLSGHARARHVGLAVLTAALGLSRALGGMAAPRA